MEVNIPWLKISWMYEIKCYLIEEKKTILLTNFQFDSLRIVFVCLNVLLFDRNL